MRYLVTGCPRSGTKTARNTMRQIGLSATHEEIFSPQGFNSDILVRKPIDGEASGFAVPYLWMLGHRVRIIHLVRHPLRCIPSLMAREILTTRKYTFFLTAVGWESTIRDKLDITKTAEWWYLWNRVAEEHADARVRIEDGSGRIAETITGHSCGTDADGLIDGQTAGGIKPIGWDDITDQEIRDKVQTMAYFYGYTADPQKLDSRGLPVAT